MEELTIEQKAKAYDKVTKEVKDFFEGRHKMSSDVTRTLEYLFPELVETDDERIRKGIIRNLEYLAERAEGFVKDELKERIVWLEKQGGHKTADKIQIGKEYKCIASPRYSTFMIGKIYKPEDKFLCSFMNFCSDCFEPIEDSEQIDLASNTDKVKPKFKIGDWIAHQGTENIYQVVAVIDNQYQLKYGDNYTVQKCAGVDRGARLWDITKDAKDGDVLSYVTDEENLWIMIYWSLYKPYEGHVHYHALLVNDNFADKGTCCICIDNLKPATKEQRDLLFAKMEEAGYEWDSEKKELKKISA